MEGKMAVEYEIQKHGEIYTANHSLPAVSPARLSRGHGAASTGKVCKDDHRAHRQMLIDGLLESLRGSSRIAYREKDPLLDSRDDGGRVGQSLSEGSMGHDDASGPRGIIHSLLRGIV